MKFGIGGPTLILALFLIETCIAQNLTTEILPTITVPGGDEKCASYYGAISNCSETFTVRMIADPSNKAFVCSELRTLSSCLNVILQVCYKEDLYTQYTIFKGIADACGCTPVSTGNRVSDNSILFILGLIICEYICMYMY